jgi:surface polysaccharide O-acyltransferase-like enzyme
VAPGSGAALGRLVERIGDRPTRLFSALVVASSLAYLPMAALFDPFRWVSFGPFFVQISRLAHYFAYFVVGIGLGAYGVDRGILGTGSHLARRWGRWSLAAILAYVVALATFIIILSTLPNGGPGLPLATLGNFTFVVSCAASSLASLAIFTHFARRRTRITDSLTANAFGIYIVHYAFVTWLQLALLGTNMPGALKGTLVFVGAVAASWAFTAAFRRVMATLRASRAWTGKAVPTHPA